MLDTTLRGHYKIVSHLGGGGFGQTYLAEDLDLPSHPTCVVKQLKPISHEPFVLETAKRLFEKEAEILYSLGTHDRIPRLLAHFQEGEEFYLVQEFADGKDLTKEIGNGRRFSETPAIALIKEVLEILVFIHERGVVHRDIKPANLIRRSIDHKIVLIDFGAVKEIEGLAGDGQGNTNLTIAIGSPGYMPIEQLNGKPRLSSDIYAVGMMGIQAITGIEPRQFAEHPDTAELVWRSHLQGDYSPQFLSILDKMIRYDFRQRYQTAAAVLEAIAAITLIGADLSTIVSASGGISNLKTVAVLASDPYVQADHPSQLHTVPFQNSPNRRLLPLWMWITGGVLLLSMIGFVLSKFSQGSVTTSNPILSPTPSLPPILPKAPTMIATPTPLASPNAALPPVPITPLSVEELLSQAILLNRNNKPQEALAKVEEALKLEPDNPDAWRAKGLLLRELGRENEAIAAFAKGRELSSEEPEPRTEERAIIPQVIRERPAKKGGKKK